jgi:uracil-DNA glycosylase family 4
VTAAPAGAWAGDPADPSTPIARSAADVADLAADASPAQLDARSSVCRACDRLVSWRESVAATRRRAFIGQQYWGRPTIGFGPMSARIAIIGLAPGAHGANRTGRIFTGDRSGDWLYAALHRAGLANQAHSRDLGDGLVLEDVRITAAVRCAPPGNAPTPAERDACRPWLARELALLAPALRVVVALGGFAWTALWPALSAAGWPIPRPRPAFGHGVRARAGNLTVLGCYHVSQQNTFTGRLTEPMLDEVFAAARQLAVRHTGAEPS